VLKSLRNSREKKRIQILSATSSDEIDCKLIFDIPESTNTMRPFY